MDVSIKREREQFLENVVKDGRYASMEAAVDESLRLFEAHERKLQALRETIDASLARGGTNFEEDLERRLVAARKERDARRKAA